MIGKNFYLHFVADIFQGFGINRAVALKFSFGNASFPSVDV